jgi:hypothetical protein
LEIFENTGHVPQMEDPDRFNRIVLDFLLSSQKPLFHRLSIISSSANSPGS